MKPLTKKEIQQGLKKLKGWELKANKIQKLFVLKDFVGAIKFVNLVAKLAEKADHHPDILIMYKKVKITLSTHDVGGISKKDFDLASKIERLLK